MTQLVIGAALGFLLAQGVLYGIKRSIAWVWRDEVRARIRTLTPPSGRAIAHASVKYGVLLGAGAALITLGVWAVGDYSAGRSAHSAAGNDVESPVAPPRSPAAESPQKVAELAPPAPTADSSTAARTESVDPYADSDFKVQRRAHAGTRLTLKETLLQRAEAKARAELLSEVRQLQNRSQYDCEAADRAAKYLKAGLDVWGFAAWQVKHFPMGGYDGATLSECQNIKDVVDPSRFDMHGAVAQGSDGRAVIATSETGKTHP